MLYYQQFYDGGMLNLTKRFPRTQKVGHRGACHIYCHLEASQVTSYIWEVISLQTIFSLQIIKKNTIMYSSSQEQMWIINPKNHLTGEAHRRPRKTIN